MKLVRVGERGSEIPGVLNDDLTSVLDARPITADFDSGFFADGGLDRLRNAVRDGKLSQLRETNLRMGAPVFKPEKIICIGLNYRNHARSQAWKCPKNRSFL